MLNKKTVFNLYFRKDIQYLRSFCGEFNRFIFELKVPDVCHTPILLGKRFNLFRLCYSFGMLLWSMLTQKIPYQGNKLIHSWKFYLTG